MALVRIHIRVEAADVERATDAFAAAGIANSAVEWEIGEPHEEAFGAPPPRLEAAQVAAYIPAARAAESETALRRALEAAWHPSTPPQTGRESVKDRDWRTAWHDHFDIVRISAKHPIIIRPPHKQYTPRSNEIVIDLTPGLAFGTGQHQSTRLALKLLSQTGATNKTVLDVGTGSGILAVAAAKLGASQVHAVDIDPLAVEAAKETARRNGVADLVTVEEGSVPADKRYDVVVANLTADLLQGLATELAAATAPRGQLIASGFLHTRQEEVAAPLSAVGFRPDRAETEGEWAALLGSR